VKLLFVNPLLTRLNSPGAAELDTFALIAALRRLGHDVRVLQPIEVDQSALEVTRFYHDYVEEPAYMPPLPVEAVRFELSMRDARRLTDLAHLDGAGWTYASPAFARLVERAIQDFRPEGVFSMMSFSWGVAKIAKQHGLPCVIRSQNNEARHLLQENGITLANLIRFIGKAAVERHVARLPTVVAAITPDEAAFYRRIAPAATIEVLPLLTLPDLLRPPRLQTAATPLHVFFMGSSYNVPHNRAALRFIVDQVVPAVRDRDPSAFVFHMLGSKVPPEISAFAADDLIFEGYMPDLAAFLQDMDIALIPSLGGAGMQQKVFEPLCRAFPTITHARVFAGYPFQDGVDMLTSETAADFVAALEQLRDPAARALLSQGAWARADALFNRDAIDGVLSKIVAALV